MTLAVVVVVAVGILQASLVGVVAGLEAEVADLE